MTDNTGLTTAQIATLNAKMVANFSAWNLSQLSAYAPAPPVVVVPPPPTFTPSPDGTVIVGIVGTITDAAGVSYRITSGQQMALTPLGGTETVAASSSKVMDAAYSKGVVLQLNSGGGIWTQPAGGGPGVQMTDAASAAVFAPPVTTPPVVTPPVNAGKFPPLITPPAAPVIADKQPVGGGAFKYQLVLDATFGKKVAGSTVKSHADLFTAAGLGAYSWLINGPADQNPIPSRPGAFGTTWVGPQGAGCDGHYNDYVARHSRGNEGTDYDLHFIADDHIKLRARGGCYNGNANDCSESQLLCGVIRYWQAWRPGMSFEICYMVPPDPGGWFSPWLATGQQGAMNADGSPGAIIGEAGWFAEIDAPDGWMTDGKLPGYTMIDGTPTPVSGFNYNAIDLPLPGQTAPFTETSVAKPVGWYFESKTDMTKNWTTKRLDWHADGTLDFYLNGVMFRRRMYNTDLGKPPMHLLNTLQIGGYFIKLADGSQSFKNVPPPVGGMGALDWPIAYCRGYLLS